MDIGFDKKAIDYINDLGGIIHLDYCSQGGGCCGTKGLLFPQIFIGSPKGNQDNYQRREIQGIKVYINKNIEVNQPVNVTLDTLLFLKKLTLSGLEPKLKK